MHDPNTYLDWSESCGRGPRLGALKWLTVIVSSVIVGLVATAIDLAAVALSDLRNGACRDSAWPWLRPFLSCAHWALYSDMWAHSSSLAATLAINWPLYLLLSCVFGLAAAAIAIRHPFTKHSGIPEISLIVAGFNYSVPVFLGVTTTLMKAAGLVLAVASGLWLGKEGPMVHVSCGIFLSVYSALAPRLGHAPPSEHLRRELLEAAAAAGIALAFNSPVGGVLFILEAMPSYLVPTKSMWSLFVAATTSLVVLMAFKIFARGTHTPDLPLFHVDFSGVSWLVFETVPFVVLGVAGGVYGYAYIRLNAWLTSSAFRPALQRRLCLLARVPARFGPYAEVLLLVVVSAASTFVFALGRLPLNDAVKMLFADCAARNVVCSYLSASLAAVLVFTATMGFVLSSWAYAADLPGGVLMPSLAIGACTGRLVGLVARHVQPALATCTSDSCMVSPSSYAVVGAAAYFTGISKLTVLVVIVMFEMTGAVAYVLPIMLLVMVAKFTNDWLCLENIYLAWLASSFNRSRDSPHARALGSWSPPLPPPTNYDKGTGRVLFTSLSLVAKCAVPDARARDVMVPIGDARCLYVALAPHSRDHHYHALSAFCRLDAHEGWPLLHSASLPHCLGYVRKAELQAQLAALSGADPEAPVSVRCGPHASNPNAALQVVLCPHQFPVVVNEELPLVTLLDMFEKLFLNSLVIMSSAPGSRTHAAGFVDRYMLSNMVRNGFPALSEPSPPRPAAEPAAERPLVPSVVVEDYDISSDSPEAPDAPGPSTRLL